MAPSSSPPRVRFDRFELDLDTGELWREGMPVALPPQPSRILVAEAGTLVERSELRQRIWGDSWLDWEAALHQAIRSIRVALDDSATAPRFVETLARRGYRFIAPIDAGLPSEPTSAALKPAPAVPSGSPTVVDWLLWRRTNATGRRALFAGLTLTALVVLPALFQLRTDARGVVEMGSIAPAANEALVAPEALRLYREGLHLLGRGAVAEASLRFRQAADLAPDWSAPWSAIAEVELAGPGGQGVDRARVSIERALARDANDAHAWRILGSLRMWEEWDWVGARGALDHAARVGPDNADVWQLVAALETVLGRETEALVAARRAMALDPISTGRRVDLGWTLYYLGRGEQALAECRRGLELEPESPWARQCVVQASLLLGRRHEASAVIAGAAEVAGVEPVAAYFQRQLDLLADGKSCGSSAAAAIPKIVLGDPEGALDALLRGAIERRGWEVPFARVDPLFAGLREEPRFAQVERALAMPVARR